MSVRNKILLSVSLFYISLGTPSVQAQDVLRLTVDQALQIAQDKSHTLKVSESKVKAAFARLNEVDAGKYPLLKFAASYTRLSEVPKLSMVFMGNSISFPDPILDNYTSKLSLTQPLFLGNKLSASSEMVENIAQASKLDSRKDNDEVLFAVRNAYWILYKAQEFKKILDENVQSVTGHLKDAKNLMEQGLLTRNDLLKIEVQLSDIKYKQADANNGVQLAMLALNNTLSISIATKIEIASVPELNSEQFGNINELLETSYRNRPDLQATKYRIQAAESGVTAAKSGWYPQVVLAGNYTYSNPNQRVSSLSPKKQFDGTWDLTLALSYDLWNWNTTGHQTEQAEAQMLQAKEGFSMMRDGVTLEVTQNYLNLNLAKEKIKISELARSQADENYRVTGEKFKQGLTLSSDLIDAEVALLTAKTNYTTSVVDYEVALAKMQKSIGTK